MSMVVLLRPGHLTTWSLGTGLMCAQKHGLSGIMIMRARPGKHELKAKHEPFGVGIMSLISWFMMGREAWRSN